MNDLYIKQVENCFFVGSDKDINFRNKKSIIQKLNEILYLLYEKYGKQMTTDESIIKASYGYAIHCNDDYITDTMGRIRNYKQYIIDINCVMFDKENDAVLYLEGMIQEIINTLSDEPDDSDEIELKDDILNIIKEG